MVSKLINVGIFNIKAFERSLYLPRLQMGNISVNIFRNALKIRQLQIKKE